MTNENKPVFILEGESWSEGWDIPTRWAIDSDKQCWMDDANGHQLEKVSSNILLSEFVDNGNISAVKAVRITLGLELKNKEEAEKLLFTSGFDSFRNYIYDWIKESGDTYSVVNALLDILKEKT